MPARVVLDRQPPGGLSDRALQGVLERLRDEPGETLLFLHGDAVERASDRGGVSLPAAVSVAVCQSSWTRRHARKPVPEPRGHARRIA